MAQVDEEAAAKFEYGGEVDDARFVATDKRTGEEVVLKFSHIDSSSFSFLRHTLYSVADFILMNFSVTDKVSFQRMEREVSITSCKLFLG